MAIGSKLVISVPTTPAACEVATKAAKANLAELKQNLAGLEEGPLDTQRGEWMRALGHQARGESPVVGFFTEGF